VDDRCVPAVEGREELITLSAHLSIVANGMVDVLLGRVGQSLAANDLESWSYVCLGLLCDCVGYVVYRRERLGCSGSFVNSDRNCRMKRSRKHRLSSSSFRLLGRERWKTKERCSIFMGSYRPSRDAIMVMSPSSGVLRSHHAVFRSYL
jgi:hypothetical protein